MVKFDWYPISDIVGAELYDEPTEKLNPRIDFYQEKRLKVWVQKDSGLSVLEIDPIIVNKMRDKNGVIYEIILADENIWKRVEDRINQAIVDLYG